MAIDPMQLILEPSIKRRNGYTYEVYDKKRKYEFEQKVFDEDEKLLEKKIKIFYDKLKDLLYANEINSFNEKIENIIAMYDLIDVNKNYLIEYFSNDHKHDMRPFEVIIQKGHFLLLELYHKKRTNEEHNNYKKYEKKILDVSDLIETFILQK
jgi:hypothetical protein